jgi:hypothetical protein
MAAGMASIPTAAEVALGVGPLRIRPPAPGSTPAATPARDSSVAKSRQAQLEEVAAEAARDG